MEESTQDDSLRSHDPALSLSNFNQYPAYKPFINTEFRRSPGKSISSFPENNRDAVVHALRNLQDKVKKLELERSTALNDLNSLSCQTSKYKDTIDKEKEVQQSSQSIMHKQNEELENQLSSAENKCTLLQKQLDYMKKMIDNTEKERQESALRNVITDKSSMHYDAHPNYNRIHDLERERFKLTTTQSLAEKKIKDLEDKLKEERRNRQLIQKRAAEYETQATTDGIFKNGEGPSNVPVKSRKVVKKKKKKMVPTKRQQAPRTKKPEPSTSHFRVNLAEIPFVAGKSTSASHAVGANVQKVLALMKTHNLALCSSLHDRPQGTHGAPSVSPSSESSSASLDTDLSDLLQQLQEEFGELSLEHQDLVSQINECRDYRNRDDLEKELQCTVEKLESKGFQISKVRQHQRKFQELKTKAKKRCKTSQPQEEHRGRPQSAPSQLSTQRLSTPRKHEDSPRPKSKRKPHDNEGPHCSRALDVLKDMKKLQTTLRREDLKWE